MLLGLPILVRVTKNKNYFVIQCHPRTPLATITRNHRGQPVVFTEALKGTANGEAR
jgi:hypothetical protein